MLVFVALLIFIASFILTFLIVPFIADRMKQRGLVSIDLNKYDKRKIPEMGGIGLWFGFSFSVMLAIFVFSYLHWIELNLTVLLAGLTTMIIVGFLGLVDDLIGWKNGLKQWQHALIPIFAALPLMAIKIDNPPIMLPLLGRLPVQFFIPLIGSVSFGVFYSLVLVPVGVTGASNATNMLAGFNGLEAGLGALIVATMLSILFLTGNSEGIIIASALLGALIAFLWFNWFPARVFGGDTLTLMTGAGIATISIIGNIEKIGVMLMFLYFVELVFKAKSRFKAECFGIPTKSGTLKPRPEGGSLTHWIMRRGSFTEKQVVLIILSMQAIVCISVFSLSFFKMIII